MTPVGSETREKNIGWARGNAEGFMKTVGSPRKRDCGIKEDMQQ